MVEYNINQMSEQDLMEAANKIFTAQERDFEKLKSEKWYQTLFHAITLNQDGKKYAVRGISSLAKLQQLFMEIYVRNYRKTHEQLDAVIEAVTRNSVAIKKLYGMCVLKLEEQESLEALDPQDAEILALFLGEYRDATGSVPEKIRDYNRGVLGCLNRKIPTGSLDNHQLRRLKAPKVVYRCFMEQCAVDGTIDTQEWSDKIYEDLKDFELGEYSKSEIKDAVKREAEIAGVDYFIVKYTKNNAGVLETDFIIDLEGTVDPAAAAKKEMEKSFDTMKIAFALTQFSFRIMIGSCGGIKSIWSGEKDCVILESPSESEVKEDIATGIINLRVLIDSINRSYKEIMSIEAYYFKETNTDYTKQRHYFLIATIDGLFFFINRKIAFVSFDSLRSVIQESASVTISARKVEWYYEDGSNASGDNKIVVEKTRETKLYLRALRKGIELLIENFGGYVEPAEDKVEKIVCKYIKQIPKNTYSPSYIVKDFGYSDDKSRKKLKKALSTYALKVREDEAIGFIDTSLFGNGGDGILFSKYGIAFDYAFEKIFARYEEIDRLEIIKGKDLVFYGHFAERKDDSNDPSISNISFDINILKACLEEILCVI